MTDESETPGKTPIADGDRPESHASKGDANETTNGTAESSLRSELPDLLTDHRRRFVLHRLETSGTPMAVADLADERVH